MAEVSCRMDIYKQTPTLKNWVQFHNVLVGYSYNHPMFKNGQRVMSNNLKSLDLQNKLAHCTDNEIWQLGHPGSYAEHNISQNYHLNFKTIFEESLDKISDIKNQIMRK